MRHSSATERVAIELSLCEAMTISAALRQFEPYWHSNETAESVAEQLAHVREDISAVIDKLCAAAAEPG